MLFAHWRPRRTLLIGRKYMAVGTTAVRIINAKKIIKSSRLVYSSSPFHRFTGADVTDKPKTRTAHASSGSPRSARRNRSAREVAVSKTCNASKTFSPSVHHAPNLRTPRRFVLECTIETAIDKRHFLVPVSTRSVSVRTHCATVCFVVRTASYITSPCLGKFYHYRRCGSVLLVHAEYAIMAMGFDDLTRYRHLPVWLLMSLAYVCNVAAFDG
jgi:hypothetical protein